MSEGLVAVQSRVAELRAMLGVSRTATTTSGGPGATSRAGGGSGTDFAGVLADALNGATGSGDPAGPVPPAGSGDSAAATGTRAVTLAAACTGVPYLWGGTDPQQGLDCSGLTQLVYGKLGVTLPRVAADQATAGTAVPSLSQARAGDLVFFGSPAHHVGIFVGDGKMIDAPHRGSTVGVHKIAGYGRVSAIRRVATDPIAGPTAGPTAGVAAAGTPGAGSASRSTQAQRVLAAARAWGLSSSSALQSSGALTAAGRGNYDALFSAAGSRYGVDPALLAAVAKTESGGDPDAVSPAGALGLMQLMPGTARSLGVDPTDPAQAVDGAARMISGLLKRFDGRVDLALAGYNAGPAAVQRHGGVPPYPETRNYVQRVTSTWEALR